jgi:hypothetical protein
MSGKDFAFLQGEPTSFYQPVHAARRHLSEEDTYRGPHPRAALGVAVGRLMWAVDGLRCAIVEKLVAYRDEEPELRRIDGVLIWLVSSVLTAISLLGGLYCVG